MRNWNKEKKQIDYMYQIFERMLCCVHVKWSRTRNGLVSIVQAPDIYMLARLLSVADFRYCGTI